MMPRTSDVVAGIAYQATIKCQHFHNKNQQKPKNFKQRTPAPSRVRNAVLDANGRARVWRKTVFRKCQ
jgi:hypothetical protein